MRSFCRFASTWPLYGPLLLTRGNSLTSVTRAELIRLAPKRIVALGAGTVLSTTVLAQLSDLAPDVLEIGELSRYSSAVAISECFSAGSTLVPAQRIAWEIVMSRKSSHASESSSFIFFLRALGSSLYFSASL